MPRTPLILIALTLLLSGCAAQPAHLFDSPLLAQPTLARRYDAPATRTAPARATKKTRAPLPPRPAPSVQPAQPTRQAPTSVSESYRACKKAGRVHFKKTLKPGDIVFFHNTYDANGDGRNNDWYTLSATVEQIGADKAAALRTPDGQTITMSLARPKDGPPHNSALRERRADDVPYTLYHAAELWAGTCAAP